MNSVGSSSSNSLLDDLNRLKELSKRVKSRHRQKRHGGRSSDRSSTTRIRKADRSDESISDRLDKLKSNRMGDRHTERRTRRTCRNSRRKTGFDAVSGSCDLSVRSRKSDVFCGESLVSFQSTTTFRTIFSRQSMGSHSKVSQSSSGLKSQVSDHTGLTFKTSNITLGLALGAEHSTALRVKSVGMLSSSSRNTMSTVMQRREKRALNPNRLARLCKKEENKAHMTEERVSFTFDCDILNNLTSEERDEDSDSLSTNTQCSSGNEGSIATTGDANSILRKAKKWQQLCKDKEDSDCDSMTTKGTSSSLNEGSIATTGDANSIVDKAIRWQQQCKDKEDSDCDSMTTKGTSVCGSVNDGTIVSVKSSDFSSLGRSRRHVRRGKDWRISPAKSAQFPHEVLIDLS